MVAVFAVAKSVVYCGKCAQDLCAVYTTQGNDLFKNFSSGIAFLTNFETSGQQTIH